MIDKLVKKMVNHFSRGSSDILAKIETSMILNSKLLTQINLTKQIQYISDVEYKVFSQWGEDGIIQYLVNSIEIPEASRSFIEFGVEDYSEANTKLLLINDNWRGLVIDGDPSLLANIEKSRFGMEAWAKRCQQIYYNR